jgi:hypothetical protein
MRLWRAPSAIVDLASVVECDQPHADELQARVVFASPEALSAIQVPGWPAASSSAQVALGAGFGADEVIADRDALDVADHDRAHTPHELALGRAIAVAGMAGKSLWLAQPG